MPSQNFIALYDLHVGRHRVRRHGELVTERSDNPTAIRTALDFARDYQPDVVVLAGDQLDAESVSHWRSRQPLLVEGFRLADELTLLDRTVLTPLEEACPNARKIWMQGNHERFVDDFVDEHPGIEGLVNIANSLHLATRGWEFYDHGEILTLGKLHFVHGEKIGGGLYHSKRAVEMYGRNIRYGHHHTTQTYTHTGALDVKDRHTAVCVPCLASKNPGYAANRPNAWVNGWLWGHIEPTGNFFDQTAILTNNRYYWNGTLYGAR